MTPRRDERRHGVTWYARGVRDTSFSLASVILGLFQVAGAVGVVYLGLTLGEVQGEWVHWAITGGGGFLGGWVAARSSRGHTVLEPFLGAILAAALFFGMIWVAYFGAWLWEAARDQSIRTVVTTAGPVLGGALVGAFLSEKLFGDSTTSTVPWVLYLLLAAFGGCLVAMFGARIAGFYHPEAAANQDLVFLGLIATGCLLSGIAGGATARRRPLAAAFIGGAIAIAGFRYLAYQAGQTIPASGISLVDENMWIVIALFGGAGGFVEVIGATLGWSLFGGQS
jgi:hypothetical protein